VNGKKKVTGEIADLWYATLLKTKTISLQTLAAGQVWALPEGFLKVVRVGKLLVDYKLLNDLEQRAAATRTDSIATVQNYLKKKRAVLRA
jgi:hypothetical protein